MDLKNIGIIDEFTEEADINELINEAFLIGIKTIDKDKNVGELSTMSLKSYITDTTISNAKKIIDQLRIAKTIVLEKYENIRSSFDEIIPISKEDVNKFDFEELSENPISLQNAVEMIKNTYITRNELQALVNDIYSELWKTVTEMFTLGFQSSMYARQYTGAVLGATEENKTYARITSYLDMENITGDDAGDDK